MEGTIIFRSMLVLLIMSIEAVQSRSNTFMNEAIKRPTGNFLIGTRTKTSIGAVRKGECTILTSTVKEAGKKQLLAIHNGLRSKVANGKQAGLPSAGNMNELHWDDELAELAQEHANNCQFLHNKPTTEKYGALGQNIYRGYPNWPLDKPSYGAAVDAWFKEKEYFSEDLIKPFVPDKRYGHFTQLVWGHTEAIGCGYTVYQIGTTVSELIVCNYGPMGNVNSQSMYKIAEPCSRCDACSKKYPGLCEVSG